MNNNITDTDAWAIRGVGCSGIITNNYFDTDAGTIFYDPPGLHDKVISNNTFRYKYRAIFVSHHGKFIIENNIFYGKNDYTNGCALYLWVGGKGYFEVEIHDNLISNTSTGFHLENPGGNVTNNTITNVNRGILISVAASGFSPKHLYVENNTISQLMGETASSSESGYGIKCWCVDTLTVANNTITNASVSSPYIKFEGGIVTNNNTFVDTLICKDNIINNTGVYGIYSYLHSGSQFIRNKISNVSYGIYNLDISNSKYHQNEIIDNLMGIYHDTNSENNSIYGNNFVDNTNQAFDLGSNNIWNESYPICGNYWSDYAGHDNYSGPNQDQYHPDGIGDTNYTNIVGVMKADEYPLMYPMINGRFQNSSIRINSNSEFNSTNGVSSGAGTSGSPYIIERDVNGNAQGSCIYIGNTTSYAIIKNSYIHHASGISGTYYWNTGIVLYNATNIKVEDNAIYSNDYGIYIYNSSYITIEDNSIHSNTYHGIRIFDSNNVTVEDNSVNSNNDHGVYLENSYNNTLIDNAVYLNSDYGFYLSTGADFNNISSNHAHQNSYGIYLSTACNNTLSSNNASTNTNGEGIRLDWYSCNNTLSDNIISYNSWGCNILTESNNNTITENNISSNNYYGVVIEDESCGNNITYNDIASNEDYGVYISYADCVNNTIFHNNFYNNNNGSVQGYDIGNNSWDNGYPFGGNYWSDYSGVDQLGGPNQNLTGSDGIGDSNYSINGGSEIDRYPLMKPNMSQYIYWAKSYGGSYDDFMNAEVIEPTSDGGYIMAGHSKSSSSGNYDFWVLKLYENGSIEWNKLYGGSGADGAMAIQETFDEKDGNSTGYIVVGYTSYPTSGVYDAWVIKLDSDGTIDWQNRFGGNNYDVTSSVKQTFAANGSASGYICAGYTKSTGTAGLYDYWVLKLDDDGSDDWQKRYGGGSDDLAYSIDTTNDSGFIVAGRTNSYGAGNKDAWVLKLNETGSVSWNYTYGGSSDDWGYKIMQTDDDDDGEKDDGYILTGYTQSYGSGAKDFWVLKLFNNGTVDWQNAYGGNLDDLSISIEQTSDGGFIATGFTKSQGMGNEDIWLLKLYSNGTIDWQKAYGGTDIDRAYRILEVDDGFVMVGSTKSFGAGQWDAWVLKTGPSGELTFDYNATNPANVTFTTMTSKPTNVGANSTSAISISSPTFSAASINHSDSDVTFSVNVQATYNYGWY